MSRYPLPTSINWSRGFEQVPQYGATVTHGIIGVMLIIAAFFIFGSGYYAARRDMLGAFSVGSFFAWVVGLFGWLNNWIGGGVFGITCGIAILGFAALWIPRND